VVSLVLLAGMILLFGSLPPLFTSARTYTIDFDDAPGISPGSPVRRSGVRIGEVTDVALDDETGRVKIKIAVERKFTIRHSEKPTLFIGILGNDASIDFVPIAVKPPELPDRSEIPPGSEIEGFHAVTFNTLLTRASDVVPTTQEAINDVDGRVGASEQYPDSRVAFARQLKRVRRRQGGPGRRVDRIGQVLTDEIALNQVAGIGWSRDRDADAEPSDRQSAQGTIRGAQDKARTAANPAAVDDHADLGVVASERCGRVGNRGDQGGRTERDAAHDKRRNGRTRAYSARQAVGSDQFGIASAA